MANANPDRHPSGGNLVMTALTTTARLQRVIVDPYFFRTFSMEGYRNRHGDLIPEERRSISFFAMHGNPRALYVSGMAKYFFLGNYIEGLAELDRSHRLGCMYASFAVAIICYKQDCYGEDRHMLNSIREEGGMYLIDECKDAFLGSMDDRRMLADFPVQMVCISVNPRDGHLANKDGFPSFNDLLRTTCTEFLLDATVRAFRNRQWL